MTNERNNTANRPDRSSRCRTRRGRRVAMRTILFVVLTVGSLAMLLPFIWMILTSLKSPAELASSDPSFFPQQWMWSNYPDAMDAAPFLTYFRNSFIIAFTHAAITVVIGSMAGYALARLPFRGRELVFLLFLAMLLIPTYTKIVPQFLMVKFMPLFGGNDIFGQGGSGWLDTWWALIIPGAVAASSVFLFRQFYLALPPELEEAARLDGLGEFGIYWKIYTPLMKPAAGDGGAADLPGGLEQLPVAVARHHERQPPGHPGGAVGVPTARFHRVGLPDGRHHARHSPHGVALPCRPAVLRPGLRPRRDQVGPSRGKPCPTL